MVGGLAVIAHGVPRFTWDIDLVVKLEPGAVERAFAALASLGYQPAVPVTAKGFGDPEQRKRWIEEKGMTVLNFQSDAHRETPIDLFVTEPFDFDRELEAANVEELAAGASARILRLEALIELKRLAGRPQDLADISELMRLHRGGDDG